MQEKWKDVVGYEGLYMVSNLGNVKSLPRKTWNGKGYYTRPSKYMTVRKDYKGYLLTYLTKNAKDKKWSIHRLVALAFIPNPDNLPQVNHKDGDKTNNTVENLEWCDNSYNQIHAYKNGLNHHSEKSGRAKKKCVKKDIITNEIIEIFDSITDAAKSMKCSKCAIRKAVYGENKLNPHCYKNYLWEILVNE